LIDKAVLSPKELALAIGVSESSLKRWADHGLINVTRTAGGHRRIPISEAIRFIRESQATVVRPELLGFANLQPVRGNLDADSDTNRLAKLFEEGQTKEALGLLLSLYLGGMSMAELCDGPLRAAMRHIGELWKHSDEGIAIEHRATDTCLMALNHLRMTLNPPDGAPVALGAALSGDPYLLPTLSSAIVLMSCGFQSINLGPETPVRLLEQTALKTNAKLIWISISTTQRPGAIAEEIGAMAANLLEPRIHIVVGGRASGDLPLPAFSNLHTATSMQQLVGLVERLGIIKPSLIKPAPLS
jgi:methanogenic corrinoid protein MtbC1